MLSSRMKAKKEARMFERACRANGVPIPMICGGVKRLVPAIVQRRRDVGSAQRYRDVANDVHRDAGVDKSEQITVQCPYVREIHGVDALDKQVRVIYNGRTYVVLYDAPFWVGGVALYVWMICAPLNSIKSDYADMDEDMEDAD